MQPDVNFLFIKIVMLVCVCWDHKLLVLLWAVFWFLGMVNCYMHVEFPISVGIFFPGFFYCNSQIKVYLSTSHVFISNSVLSFHFIFQRSFCSIQAIKKLLKICSFFCFTEEDTECRLFKPWTATAPSGFLEPVGADVCSDTGKASQQRLVPYSAAKAWRNK